jgi:hypothetical protein
MSRTAQFEIVSETDEVVTIRDIGPWHLHPTVTNDAKTVVADLHATRNLGARKLLYYDSENILDELEHDGNGRFTGFAPGPR